METKMKAQLAVLLAALAGAGCRPVQEPTKYESYEEKEFKARLKRDAPVPELDLKAPADASAADLEATAKAMTDRAASYGYQGVTAQVVQDGAGPRVRLACPTGITKEMRPVLRTMGTVMGQQVEIRHFYRESQAEREQNLYTYKGRKAPPGAQWYEQYIVIDPEGEARLGISPIAGPRLLLDAPVLRAPELRGPDLRNRMTSYEFVQPQDGTPSWKFGVFLVDGKIITETMRAYPGGKSTRVYVGDDDGPLGHCLKFPMPLRLESTPSLTR